MHPAPVTKGCTMTTDLKLPRPVSDAITEHRRPWAETVTSYERELSELRRSEVALREVLACEDALLHQKDDLIQLLEILNKESDHRFLNSLQMIASLLSMQARTSVGPETARQLGVAADRVTMTVALKLYLEELCCDFAKMLGTEDGSKPMIRIDAIEAELPSATGIPLGFIVSELITNAAKYGKGRINVRLEADGRRGYALSVSNDGLGLPSGFDPNRSKGLGMTIIQSLVAKIGGELQFGPGDQGQGARFTVLFG
jgi:two-component system, sensor histidine kinase PdtaS